jgi:sirohydrochlorin cobaltochelatase
LPIRPFGLQLQPVRHLIEIVRRGPGAFDMSGSGWQLADSADPLSFEALELRLRTILPSEYQDRFDDVQPTSMGSAALKYGADGKVAWDDIWGSFCDLAMAGGPPHKGALLEPGSRAEIEAQPDRYRDVVDEISRGIAMVTGFVAEPSPTPGWVRVDCVNQGAVAWLARAIVMENISARCERTALDLPAAPSYRLEKEIKNVITAIAKTSHYWFGHMDLVQRRLVANLFAKMEMESPLAQPPLSSLSSSAGDHQPLREKIAEAVRRRTGLQRSNHQYTGWLGFECGNVHAAIWMMRAIVVSNVLSRREGTVLFVPVNPATDPGGEIVARSVVRVHAFASARNIL